MGCDIHSVIEYRAPDCAWRVADFGEVAPLDARHYDLFTLLKGVRRRVEDRDGFGYIDGYSNDADDGMCDEIEGISEAAVAKLDGGYHNLGCLTLQEILSPVLWRPVKREGWTNVMSTFGYYKSIGSAGSCYTLCGPSSPGAERVEWTGRNADYAGELLTRAVPMMASLSVPATDVRLIFSFDN